MPGETASNFSPVSYRQCGTRPTSDPGFPKRALMPKEYCRK
jgi:hypothetical protein